MTDPLAAAGKPIDDEPRCATCGVEITTGLMGAFCPRKEKCEFWDDGKPAAFLEEFRG